MINSLLRFLKVCVVFRIGKSYGDQLCISGFLREFSIKNKERIVVISNNADFFLNNPNISLNIGLKKISNFALRVLRRFQGTNLIYFNFDTTSESFESYMRNSKSKKHIIELYSHNRISSSYYKNEIFFSDKERNEFEKKFKDIHNYAVIQPNTKTTYTPNKEWSFDSFQEVVKELNQVKWIQIGHPDERLLDDVIDYRGLNFRELFFVISKAKFALSCEGFVNHICSAFETKSFVVLSGFHNEGIANYRNSIFIKGNFKCPEDPCWLLDDCPINKKCIDSISVKSVVSKINEINLYN